MFLLRCPQSTDGLAATMHCPSQRTSFAFLFLILCGIKCDSGTQLNSRHKRDFSNEQPRMSSENGNLLFLTGSAKNIEFKTGTHGRIKVNEDDVTELLNQIRRNKDDITELKRTAGGVPQNVSNQIVLLNSKIANLENRCQSLEQTVQRKACSSNPCQNLGTCLNLLDAFFCLCTNSWQGALCSVDVNECQVYTGTPLGCQNRGVCQNTPGSYRCDCPPEWSGRLCTAKYDDCQGGARDLCVHGICVDVDRVQEGQPKYNCVCHSGWMAPAGNSACTADIDECSLPSFPCSQDPPVQCFNTPGSFYCGECPTGWKTIGPTCQDINECETDNGGCSVAPFVPCINTRGSYHCGLCPPGYEGNGKVCTPVDMCSVNNGGCHPFALCTPGQGSPMPTCVCLPGLTGNGFGPTGCVPVSDICQQRSPCVNGQCITTILGYVCQCDPGWTGTNCTENINECASNPCQNGGACTDGVNGYLCNCTSRWTGPQCQTPQQACGGTLLAQSGSFSYPNNPGSERYDHNVSCSWLIRTEPGMILRVTFPLFHLEGSARCSFDSLQIHDGETASDVMLGKYCGTTIPAELFSSHNSLYFWFKSDHSISHGGFTVVWETRQPECGGLLTDTHGSINSPGYPGNYPPSRDCYWAISTNPGLIITFAFGTLSIEHHDRCASDYLQIRDGLLSEDPILGTFCSTGSPPPVQTTGPNAWIHFHSDSTLSDRGFQITYTTSSAGPGCGGNHSDSEGVITSPYWPDSYTNSRQCIYTIWQPPNEKINLTFTTIELESQSGCSWNYIEVRDGATETSPLFAKFCNSTVPASIISSSNKIWVRFRSDTSVTRARFRAIYQTACGGAQSGEGVLRSPHFPSAYPHGKTCEWILTQPEGEVVILTFTAFDLENTTGCTSGYVEVRDGSSIDSPLIGKYCGQDLPPPIRSTQRFLFVKFQTDGSTSNHGFMAQFHSLDKGCGQTLTAPEGSITSPGHPTVYPHGVNCTWIIAVQPHSLIRLTFTVFNLQFSTNCANDYLEVYDNGTAGMGTKLGRYCGRSIPPSFTSSGNTMVLFFRADAAVAMEGFSASYASVDASKACMEEYTDAAGMFTSPDYPNVYPNNRECVYKITVETNKQIMLNFTEFSLESSSNCVRDYVEIRDGGYETSVFLARYCDRTRPPVIISHSNRLWIQFKSDYSVAAAGFVAQWDGTATGCGATLTTPSGSFMSPNYPMPYHQNAECYWLLKAASGTQLEIQFQDFQLESHKNCNQDYLDVYNGNNTNAKLLAKLCGDEVPGPIRSTANSLYVKLRTDTSLAFGGFMATYRQICQGVVIANQTRGILESANYPQAYPHNMHCNWTIQASSGNTINYTFSAFNLEPTFSCAYDYVKLYDGPSSQSNLIGTFCSNNWPPSGGTTGRNLHVVFHSDESGSGPGFQMQWNVNGCGGDLSGSTGSFTSPGYPRNYPANKECLWYIQTAPGSSIQIAILDFNVEYHPGCEYDVLEIYGGPDLQSPRLAQLCNSRGVDNPLHVSSAGNTATIRFKTDYSINGKGFNATWQEIPGGCGGVFQASSGEIHSPNYPSSLGDNLDCSWLIRVDQGHRAILNFTDLDIQSDNTCTQSSINVFDGPSSDAPLLASLCGGQPPAPIRAQQNTLFVRLRSRGSIQHRGFSARFIEACGSFISVSSIGATISSPLFPATYPINQNCSWIITAQEPFNHVTLSFIDFEVENRNRNCSTDYVEILDGDNLDAPLHGRYCGTSLPHPVTSFSNSMLVSFVSNSAYSAKGFRASYAASSSACGGTFYMQRGAFNSPGFPESYPPNIECVWTILSSPGNRLQLSFINFHLSEDENCAHDYLEVREGNDTGVLVGRFCGNALPDNFTSATGHVLWIKFVSDGSLSGPGFQATFSHVYQNSFVGQSGQIASPLWPRNYPHNANNLWTVNVDASQVIEVRILEMDIEDHGTCSFDRLRIYDGPDTHSHIIGTYCGPVVPPAISSFGSAMTFKFQSDGSVSRRGFLLEWNAIEASAGPIPTIAPGACGGILMTGQTPSFLFSPGWPAKYGNRMECTWLIRSPGSTIEFNILALDIESHSSCNYDKLEIRDGDSNLAPVLSTICGREPPGPIRSTGDSMFLKFTSDGSVTGMGFNSSFHKSCGGYLHVDRGIITSPNYAQDYAPNLNCSWHVVVTSGFTIAVHFEPEFQIQNDGASCSSGDYLELRNGWGESSPPLSPEGGNGRFCGSSPPSTMHTTDNQLYVHFFTDSSQEGQGFKIKYEAKSLACGGNIYVTDANPSGVLTSPNYPNNYAPNADCVWIITVPNGEAVELQFTDPFYIEPSDNCSSAYLQLRDGADSNARELAKLCGNTRPGVQKSLGTAMYVRFRSDNRVTRPGFSFTYSIATCGGTLTGRSGIIQSPGFPTSNYPNSFLCEWYLHGPTGHYLSISFETLDLQNSTGCVSDYVEIREYNGSGNVLGKFCSNTIPHPMDTSDSFAYVKLVSDGSGSASGFRLHFEASTEECGGDLNADTGTITSPNYPNLYPHNRVCEWRITVPVGRRVTFAVNDMRIQDEQNCDHDYVAVINGLRPNSPSLQRMCGYVSPGTQVKSSGNTMKVIFATDGAVSSGGFSATYTSEEDAVCGNDLVDPAGGNITSPGYNRVNNYTSNLNCEWTIQNPKTGNTSIYISLVYLRLEQHPNCQKDFLELRIDSADGELITRLCGRSVPSYSLAIAAPRVWVHFVTNSRVEDLGFEASYMFTDCGGVQTGEGGVIASPNYPAPYSSHNHCAWLLEAQEGHTITLTFTYFDTEYHTVCRWDSVTVMNGGSTGSPIIGQYCGTTSPGIIQSGSNKLVVMFNSDTSIHGGGFYATWTTDSLGCGGVIHSESGTIKTPHWPQNYPANSRCVWTIYSHESKHLEINFDNNFNIPENGGQCQSSFVKVWDGLVEAGGPLLTSGCGTTAPGPVVAPKNVATVIFQSQESVGAGFSASFISRCGVNFTSMAGRIVSPNYPNQYDNNLNCNYFVNAGAQMYVILTFQTFELEGSDYCRNDGVQIFRGSSTSPLTTLCGNVLPGAISSLGPLRLHFYSNSATTAHGFTAQYKVLACGGTFNATFGVISSPTYSFTEYHNNMNCTYRITVEPNRVVELKFNRFALEASSSCAYDYVAVYDGPDMYSAFLGKFCGQVLPPTLKSSGSSLFLVFRTDPYGTAGGWRATYRQTLGSQQGCGGYLTSISDSFRSPDANLDGRYDHNLNCVWNIMAPINKNINLTFTAFVLEAHSGGNCIYDYVKLYDGDSENANLEGTFCGSTVPAPFVSTGNSLTVVFASDSSVERAGFNATYTAQDSLCGGIVNATSLPQTTASPFFPNEYPRFTSCLWIIDAPPQEQVKLMVETFQLHGNQPCSQNYLELSDSPVGDKGQVHRFCGSDTFAVPVFYSYARTVKVLFKSEEYISGNGVSFAYQVAGCNREYNQTFGYLKSPGWPASYPHKLDCTIILRAPQNHSISLFFNAFHLEFTCADFLEVKNGSDASSPLLGKYCGSAIPSPIFPNNHVLHLHFVSDILHSGSGYDITWTSSPTGCGGVLYGDHGSFTSPNYPAPYGNNTHCEWTIVAPMGRIITVQFVSINIDDPGDCSQNYLELYNGPDDSHLASGPFCGLDTNIAPFAATSNRVFVRFHADYTTLPSGFRLTWTS
ncbi:cubilin [Ambystoma mexicanum]|uniref:cubilin n=1 Tax=Ambystoma mexicanum TaxID=8296 RepID=UPI0037E80D61